MTRQSTKPAAHAAKTGRRGEGKSAKKPGKSLRVAAKKAAKTVRGEKTVALRDGAEAVTTPMMRTPSAPTQPAAARVLPARAHKYRVGETVYFNSPSFGRAAASGSYTVVRLLPSEGDDYLYRIKSAGEAFERVAKESQLEKA